MQKLIFSLALAALAALVFAGVRSAGFVWNDRTAIFGEESGGTAAETAPAALPPGRVATAWELHRNVPFEPLAPTVWGLAIRLSSVQTGGLPRLLHVLSLGVHLGSAILVLLILAGVLQSLPAAFIGALLFAVHPLQVEPVAYVAGFKYVLGGFFSLAAIWQYLVWAQTRDSRGRARPLTPYYLATVCFVLAVLSSQAMVVTPLLAWLMAKLLPKKTSLIASRTPAWPLATWMILALPATVLMIGSQNTAALSSQLPFWSKPVVAADAISFYLSKIFAPVLIGPDYGRSPSYLISHWWGFLTWVLPASLLLVLGYWRSKARLWYIVAAAVLCAAVLPYLGLYLFEGQATSTVANRYAYLAMLGPALAAAYTVSMPKRTWLPIAVVAATLAFGYLSRMDLVHWQSDEDLWRNALSVNPTSPIANATLADAYRRKGDWENARIHYERVLQTNALTPDIHFYLGEIERQHGDPKKAVAYYQRTLALDPAFAEAYVRLGRFDLEAGDRDAALTHFQKAVELAPESEESVRSLGMIYVRRKAYSEALPYLTKALRLGEGTASPKAQADSHALLGLALANTHQPDVAQGHLETALKLDPDHQEANRVLADIYYAQGKYDLAKPHYEKALAQGGADFDAYRNLGEILARDKQHWKAVGFFAKALELKPDQPETLSLAGISYFRNRQLKEASDAFNKALALKPNMAEPHYYLGDIARWQGKEPEALAEYYKAVKIEPNHADANYRLGNHFMKEKKIGQAIRHYQAALKSDPEDPRLVYSLKNAEKAKDGAGTTDVPF